MRETVLVFIAAMEQATADGVNRRQAQSKHAANL
jgi:hypothetical protein